MFKVIVMSTNDCISAVYYYDDIAKRFETRDHHSAQTVRLKKKSRPTNRERQ